jgi:hypothetical protein
LKTIVIGISDRTLRFLGMSEQKEISFIESIDTTFSFSECFKTGIYEDTLVTEASYIINNVLRDLHTASTKIGILLDSSFVFFNTIPIDFSESVSNISSWILWDLSNYFPDNYKNHKVNYYKLNHKKFNSSVRDTLIVSFDKNILQVLVKIFHSGRLKFQIFDIDHFAAEKYMKTFFEGKLDERSFLITGCKKNHIDISVYNRDGLLYYDYLIFRDTGYRNKLRNKIREISKAISGTPVTGAMIYGEDYSEDVYNFLAGEFVNTKFFFPDPLTEFRKQDYLKSSDKFKNEGNKFLPLFGLALKAL